jgi:hypothetical protein
MIWILLILLTACSAILYRCGGASKEEGHEDFPFLPSWFLNTKARDVGCSLCTTLAAALAFAAFGVSVPWWSHILAFGTLWGMLTTYWDFGFGFDNYWFHGFMCGMAAIWYCIFGDLLWWIVGARAVYIALFMGIWCIIFQNDVIEECGRGSSLIL